MVKDDCIFCKLANGDIPVNALYEDDVLKVIFDAGPATRGHVLIIPKNHFDNIYDLDDDTAAHVAQTAVKIAKAMNKALGYEGLNVVQNNGLAAGQTGGLLAQSQIAQAHVVEHLEPTLYQRQIAAGGQGLVHAHGHKVRKRKAIFPPCPAAVRSMMSLWKTASATWI